jgi:hypothetical protein
MTSERPGSERGGPGRPRDCLGNRLGECPRARLPYVCGRITAAPDRARARSWYPGLHEADLGIGAGRREADRLSPRTQRRWMRSLDGTSRRPERHPTRRARDRSEALVLSGPRGRRTARGQGRTTTISDARRRGGECEASGFEVTEGTCRELHEDAEAALLGVLLNWRRDPPSLANAVEPTDRREHRRPL